jgi:hypothetical protein
MSISYIKNETNKHLAAVFLMLLPCMGVANEASEEINQLRLNELYNNQKALNELDQNGLSIDNQRMTKGKAELEKILGSWMFSYTVGGVSRTDRLELEELYEKNDGDIGISGTLFLNNEGEGQLMICDEIAEDLVSFFDADFNCFSGTEETFLYTYDFRISGDVVTNGYFGEGATIEDVVASSTSKNHNLTGSRGGGQTTSTGNEANFNEGSNELIIPVVNYRGSKFRVILQNNGDFLFSVKEAKPL